MRLNVLAALLPEKKLWFLWSWRLGGSWKWTGYFGVEIALFLQPGFKPQIFQQIF